MVADSACTEAARDGVPLPMAWMEPEGVPTRLGVSVIAGGGVLVAVVVMVGWVGWSGC